MRKKLPYIAIWVFCSALGGSCDEDLYSPDWTPLDYDGFVRDLEEPTGTLVDDSPQKTADRIEERLGYAPDVIEDVLLLYQQMELLLDVLEDSQENEQESNEASTGSVRGTNIYARISCLGPDVLDRSIDFEFGEIRLEGSDFSLDEAMKSGFSLGGDVLVAFRDCLMANRIMRGVNPAFASVRSDEFLVDLDVSVEKSSGSQHQAQYPFLVRRNEIVILADTGENGTYVLSIKVGRDTVITITTAEGTFGCSVGVSGLDCESTVANNV